MLILLLVGSFVNLHNCVQASQYSSASLPEIYRNVQHDPNVLRAWNQFVESYQQDSQNYPDGAELGYYDDITEDSDCPPGQICTKYLKGHYGIAEYPQNDYEYADYTSDIEKLPGSVDIPRNLKSRIYQKSAGHLANNKDGKKLIDSLKQHVTEEHTQKSIEHQEEVVERPEESSNNKAAQKDNRKLSNNENYGVYDEYESYPEEEEIYLSGNGKDENIFLEEDYREEDDLDLGGQDYTEDDYVEAEDILQNVESIKYVEIDHTLPAKNVQIVQTEQAGEYEDYQDYQESNDTNYLDYQNYIDVGDDKVDYEIFFDHGQYQIVGNVGDSDYGKVDKNYQNYDKLYNQQSDTVPSQSKNYIPKPRVINTDSVSIRDTAVPFKNSKFLRIPEDAYSVKYPVVDVDRKDLISGDWQYATNPDYVDYAINGGNYVDYDQIDDEENQENVETENQGNHKPAENNLQTLEHFDKNDYRKSIPENPVYRIITKIMYDRQNRKNNEYKLNPIDDFNKNVKFVGVEFPASSNSGYSFSQNNRPYFQHRTIDENPENEEVHLYRIMNRNQLAQAGFKMQKSFNNQKPQGHPHSDKVGAPRIGVNSNNQSSLFNVRNQPIQGIHDYMDYDDETDYIAENNVFTPHPDKVAEQRRRQELQDLEDLKHLKRAREDRLRAIKLNNHRRELSNRRPAPSTTLNRVTYEKRKNTNESKLIISNLTTSESTKQVSKSFAPQHSIAPQKTLTVPEIVDSNSAPNRIREHLKNNPPVETHNNPIVIPAIPAMKPTRKPQPIIKAHTQKAHIFNKPQHNEHQDISLTYQEYFPIDEYSDYQKDLESESHIFEETQLHLNQTSYQDYTEYSSKIEENISKDSNKKRKRRPKHKKKHLRKRKNHIRRPISPNPINRPSPIVIREPIRRKQPSRTRKVIKRHRGKPRHARKINSKKGSSSRLTKRRQSRVKG